jgi:hypothetical protein
MTGRPSDDLILDARLDDCVLEKSVTTEVSPPANSKATSTNSYRNTYQTARGSEPAFSIEISLSSSMELLSTGTSWRFDHCICQQKGKCN